MIRQAQAAYENEWVPLAAYDGEAMIGFAMYGLDPDYRTYWILHVMIAQEHQRKGYDRTLMDLLIARLRSVPCCEHIALGYEYDNDVARGLYTNLGFVETGEKIEGVTVARLHLDKIAQHSAH